MREKEREKERELERERKRDRVGATMDQVEVTKRCSKIRLDSR